MPGNNPKERRAPKERPPRETRRKETSPTVSDAMDWEKTQWQSALAWSIILTAVVFEFIDLYLTIGASLPALFWGILLAFAVTCFLFFKLTGRPGSIGWAIITFDLLILAILLFF